MNTLAQLDAVERAVTSRLADGRPANVVRIRTGEMGNDAL